MAGTKKGGLGRGLEALFADSVPVTREVKPLETAAKPEKKSAEKAERIVHPLPVSGKPITVIHLPEPLQRIPEQHPVAARESFDFRPEDSNHIIFSKPAYGGVLVRKRYVLELI